MEIKRLKTEFMDSNVFVIVQGGHALIIDSGAKLEEVKKAVGSAKVVALLLTHAHFDHCYYSLDYAKEFNCKIYMNENGKKIASSAKSNYSEDGFAITDFSAFHFLSGDGQLDLSPFKVEYYSTAGHSPCSTCYKVGEEFFTGDTLFSNGIGRTDLIGSSKEDMIKSLDKLSRMFFATAHSGHGEDSDFSRQKRNITLFKRFLTR